ncbi:MAG: peptidase S53, partial [Terriglobales bacterium]
PIGFLNPLIYAQAVEASGFHDMTQGNNGAFSAGPGWDPCTGLGSPDGVPLEAALTGTSAATSGIHATSSTRPRKSKESAA